MLCYPQHLNVCFLQTDKDVLIDGTTRPQSGNQHRSTAAASSSDILIPIQIRPLSQHHPLEQKDLVLNHTLRVVSLSLGRARLFLSLEDVWSVRSVTVQNALRLVCVLSPPEGGGQVASPSHGCGLPHLASCQGLHSAGLSSCR